MIIKANYSEKKGKYYVAMYDRYGCIVTFDSKVWLPLASAALNTKGYDDTIEALVQGAKVKVGGVKE